MGRTQTTLLLFLLGCSESEVDMEADACLLSSSDESPCDSTDCSTDRSFHLAATGVQARPNYDNQPFFQIGTEGLADDVDAVAIHEDFLGIPWERFANGQDPPEAWVAKVDALDAAAGVVPVFLSLQLVGGPGRAWLGNKTVVLDSGELGNSESEWSEKCFDFSGSDGDHYREAFVAYALWMVDRLDPAWLNIAIEMNLYYEDCPRTWPALVEAEASIYASIKAAHADLPVFPSIVLESLYGLDPGCTSSATTCLEESAAVYEERYAALNGVARDRFAISVYPFGFESMREVERIPSDFFTAPAERGGEQLVIAETGWNSAPVRVQDTSCGDCVTWRRNECGAQAAYLERLVKEADATDMDLLTWWSHRDFIPSGLSSTCDYRGLPPEWKASVEVFQDSLGCYLGDIVFKLWGTMGIRTYDGRKKDVYSTWEAIKQRPIIAESSTD